MPSVKELTKLLDKISQTKDRVKVEINYDGKEFHWIVPQINPTASDWNPRNLNTQHHSREP